MGRGMRAHLESQDILQSALLRAFRHIDQFEGGDTDSLMAWLARIAENEIRNQAAFQGRQRRDSARQVALEAGREAVAEQVRSLISRMVLDEETARLERALEALDEHHREIILLRKFQELSFQEIGRRLGKSTDACRMMLARAMTALTLKMRESP
jgi:RNA polymerase sigma-70 factor (ECF subfamily)